MSIRIIYKKWFWLLTILVFAATALAAWSAKRVTSKASTLVAVRRGELLIEAPATGLLVAARSVDITAPISSDPHFFKVARLTPEGTLVQPGQTVMELDTQEVAQRLRDYQAEVNKTQEELAKRKLEYDLQLRDLRVRIEQARVRLETAKLKNDIDPQLMSAQQRRQNQIELEQATQEHKLLGQKLTATEQMVKGEMAVLEKNLANVRLRVEKAQALQASCTVKAPLAGTLVYKVMADGAKRKVGEQTCHHEVILQIPDLSTLRLEATVEESYAGQVQVGQPVRIKLDALPDEKLTGKVTRAGTVLHTKRDSPVKVIDLVIELDTKPGKLSPGMTATGQIEIERVAEALLIPLKAVQEREGRVFVRVPGHNGQMQERAIRLGRRNRELVEVMEGVSEGEKLGL